MNYIQELIIHYQDEITGEHYFRTLIEYIPEHQKFLLKLAETEQLT